MNPVVKNIIKKEEIAFGKGVRGLEGGINRMDIRRRVCVCVCVYVCVCMNGGMG